MVSPEPPYPIRDKLSQTGWIVLAELLGFPPSGKVAIAVIMGVVAHGWCEPRDLKEPHFLVHYNQQMFAVGEVGVNSLNRCIAVAERTIQ